MTEHLRIERVTRADKDVILVAPALVDPETLEFLDEFITAEAPDTVCLGTDPQRHEWTAAADDDEAVDLVEAIRGGEGEHLWSYLALGVLQKKFVRFDGTRPGQEMHVAERAARACGARVELVDRDMATTCVRGWRTATRWERLKLSAVLTWVFFQRSTTDPLAHVDEQRQKIDEHLPIVSKMVLDESAQYVARRIAETDGQKVVVVTSPAFINTIRDQLAARLDAPELDELDHVPPKSLASRAFPWVLSAIIAGAFVLGFAFGDVEKMTDAALAWVLCNGILAALGGILSLAHPLTIVAVFAAAPIVSLNPAVGAGAVGLLVQALVVPPTLRDMERVGDDLAHWTGWWRNRMARLLVIFVFVNIGSTIGSFAALAWFPDVL